MVADFFAGSGMAGLATFKYDRKSELSDISVLGRHIAQSYLTPVTENEMRSTASVVMNRARSAFGSLYWTKRASDGVTVEMARTVWSFTYLLVYFHHLSPKGERPAACPSSHRPFARRHWPRVADVSVEVVFKGEQGKLTGQDSSEVDRQAIRQAIQDPCQHDVPSLTIDANREMHSRSGLGKAGMTETAMFFSPWSAIALLELWRGIHKVEDERLRQKLRFTFTAILPRVTTLPVECQAPPERPESDVLYCAGLL